MLPVSFGDAADRFTILEIKKARIADPARRANVIMELEMVAPLFHAAVARTPEFDALLARLRTTNETLWTIEDDIRACEKAGDFGPEFVRLARAVYAMNDERARIKREINVLLGSPLMEEKSYADHGAMRTP